MTNTLPEGWTEAEPGGMATNRDQVVGGIVDKNHKSGEWFAIFGPDDGLSVLEGFTSRNEAFAALHEALLPANG